MSFNRARKISRVLCRFLNGRTRCQSLEHTWTHPQKQRVKRKRNLTCEGLSGSLQNQDPEQDGPHTSSRLPAGQDDSPDSPDSTDSSAAQPQSIDWREFRCCQTYHCTSPCDLSGHCLSCMPAAKQAEILCLRLHSRRQRLCFSWRLLQPHTSIFRLAERTLRASASSF